MDTVSELFVDIAYFLGEAGEGLQFTGDRGYFLGSMPLRIGSFFGRDALLSRLAYQIRNIACPRLRWTGTGPALKTENVS